MPPKIFELEWFSETSPFGGICFFLVPGKMIFLKSLLCRWHWTWGFDILKFDFGWVGGGCDFSGGLEKTNTEKMPRWWFHFFFSKWSNLTIVFQMGWNHQLDAQNKWRIFELMDLLNLSLGFFRSRERLRVLVSNIRRSDSVSFLLVFNHLVSNEMKPLEIYWYDMYLYVRTMDDLSAYFCFFAL